MSIFASRRLQDFWRHIYSIRYRILQFASFLTSNQFIATKDVWKKSWSLVSPFFTSCKTMQLTIHSHGFAKKHFNQKPFQQPLTCSQQNVSAFKKCSSFIFSTEAPANFSRIWSKCHLAMRRAHGHIRPHDWRLCGNWSLGTNNTVKNRNSRPSILRLQTDGQIFKRKNFFN